MVALKFTNGYIDKRIHDRNRYRGYGSFGFDHGNHHLKINDLETRKSRNTNIKY